MKFGWDLVLNSGTFPPREGQFRTPFSPWLVAGKLLLQTAVFHTNCDAFFLGKASTSKAGLRSNALSLSPKDTLPSSRAQRKEHPSTSNATDNINNYAVSINMLWHELAVSRSRSPCSGPPFSKDQGRLAPSQHRCAFYSQIFQLIVLRAICVMSCL